MKLISLNILGGKRTKELLKFIHSNSETDIFCFQEVFDKGKCTRSVMEGSNMNIFEEIIKELPEHRSYFAPHQDEEEGLALFVKNNLLITDYKDVFVHRYKNAMKNNHGGFLGRNIQSIKLNLEEKEVTVINFHGLWSELGKIDTPARKVQSANILNYIKSVTGEVIFCGDLNLKPETESLKMFRDYCLIDLIREYKITSTRSSMYSGDVKFADYCFVSKDIKVKEFRVLQEEVSDHLPLYLDFE